MNELMVRYYHNNNSPRCQVCYRSEAGIKETREFPFTFSISNEDRKLLQWYLEEYLTYPYDVFQDRAKKAESVISEHGKNLFNAIFHNKNGKDAIEFYKCAMQNPANCHIIIQADHPAGWSLPWKFIYDPAYGYLAQKVDGFVRSLPQASVLLKSIRRFVWLMVVQHWNNH